MEFRTLENGKVCCCSYSPIGERIPPKYPCKKCEEHFAETIPDPYAEGVAEFRAATATDQSRAEDAYKAERLRALELEYAAWEDR